MKNLFLITIFLLVFSGCTSMQSVPVEKLSRLPVVRVGDKPPSESEYIVYYPAGYTIPITLKASGSLFSETKKVESHVKLSKNLYLYKYWASHDKKTWKNSHELLGVQFSGGFDITGIQVNVDLDAK